MVLRTRLLILFTLLIMGNTYAQSDSLFIALIAKSKKDGVWLRWAPSNPLSWYFGNAGGYNIERFTLRPDGEIDNPLGEKLNDTPIQHYTEEALLRLSSTVREASVIREVIYGEGAIIPPVSDNPGSLLARNQEMENNFGMTMLVCDLSTQVAQAAGLYFIDKTAEKGKRYIYRVSIARKPPTDVHPGIAVLSVTDEKPMMEISDLKAEFSDQKVSLSWSTLLHRGIYSAYYIEKSTDGKTFKRVSELPYVYISEELESERTNFTDSLDANNKTFHYRIIGISPFAELGPPSVTVRGMGKSDLTGILIIREAAYQKKNNEVKIAWVFPQEMENQISSFVVSKAIAESGPYQDLFKKVTPAQRMIMDVTAVNYNYYKLRAIDKAGKELCRSFPYFVLIPDTIPPIAPVGLTGKISKEGIVTISWQANNDVDLLGYRVFYSNNPRHEFVEATTAILPAPDFTDTIQIRVLNKPIYYVAASVDRNYNPSIFSKPVKLLRPDIIPPGAPSFTFSGVRDGHIYLSWIKSPSDDVATYALLRQEAGDTIKTNVLTIPSREATTSFTDNTATLGKTYRYTLSARDSTGNSSESVTGRIAFETGIRPPITDFTALVDRDNKQLRLQWKNSTAAVRYMLYRKVNDQEFILYHTTEDASEFYIEKNLAINNTYTYTIQAVYSKGVKSSLSKELVVKF